MTALPNRWRRLAMQLAQHAAWVVPGARAPWVDAMRRELDYIGDDAAAVRWALGCVVASYRMRLTEPPRVSARRAWRQVATCGALMLMIGLALHDNAGGQTDPPRPGAISVPANGQSPHVGVKPSRACEATDAADRIDRPAQAPDASCGDRTQHEADERIH